MKTFRWFSLLLLITISFALAEPKNSAAANAILLNVNGAIGPATQDYIHRGLMLATKQQAALIIMQLNTPGGLDKSMRGIVSDILAAPVPVVVYVAPSGARAASAGTFILYAAHIAAMAPGTNVGAATPVGIEFPNTSPERKTEKPATPSTSEKKALADAMAYIRGIAQLRNRNVQWAEQAVSKGASLSANEALQMKVIDVVARNITDLLTQINGQQVTVQNQQKVLNTANLAVQELHADWRNKFLSVITDPNVAYILLMIGIWGLFFEFVSPGFVLPGVTGAISLLIALYAFQLLPINYAGLALILLGVSFLIAEAFIASFGILGIGGTIALIIGSIFLLEAGVGTGYSIALPVIVAVSAATAMFFLIIINIALRSRFKPVVSGKEELLGSVGTVILDEGKKTYIRVHGEMWEVKSDQRLVVGQKVKVIGIDGLVLKVEPN